MTLALGATAIDGGFHNVIYPSKFFSAPSLTSDAFADEILNTPFDVDTIVQLLPRRLVEFREVSAEVTDQRRTEFADKKSFDPFFMERLKKRALKELKYRWGTVIPIERLSELLNACESHHRRPLSWGGTNKRKNFTFMHTDIHAALHRELNRIRGRVKAIENRYQVAKKSLPPLHDAMVAIGGAYINGMKYVMIPYPTDKVCIPQLIQYQFNIQSGLHDDPRARVHATAEAKGIAHG